MLEARHEGLVPLLLDFVERVGRILRLLLRLFELRGCRRVLVLHSVEALDGLDVVGVPNVGTQIPSCVRFGNETFAEFQMEQIEGLTCTVLHCLIAERFE